MDFYTQSAATALGLLQKFGKPLPIKRATNTPDPVTGEVTQVETSGSLAAVVLPAKTTGNQAVNGSMDNAFFEALTKGRARYVLAAAQGAPFEPDAGDVLTFEGASWQVLGCTPLAPAGIPVVFKLGAVRV